MTPHYTIKKPSWRLYSGGNSSELRLYPAIHLDIFICLLESTDTCNDTQQWEIKYRNINREYYTEYAFTDIEKFSNLKFDLMEAMLAAETYYYDLVSEFLDPVHQEF